MTVYRGILKYVSGGLYNNAVQGRSFLEIGSNRIDGVVLSHYQDEMLLRFVGQEVALSGVRTRMGNFQVFAIRSPNGEVFKRSPLDPLVINVLIFFLGTTLGGAIGSSNIILFNLIGWIIIIYTYYFSIFETVKVLRARSALDS